MPTYEYECSRCGHKFEKVQPITGKPVRKCPKCAKLAVKRLFSSGGGIIFKGSGFYQTDYRSKSYQEKAKQDAAPKEKSAETKSPSNSSEPRSEKKKK